MEESVQSARHWSWRRKVLTTWVVSLFKFLSGLASSSIVPSLGTIGDEFGTEPGPLRALPLSSYFLGYAVGLLVLGSLSETFGRVGVLVGSNLFFIVFNTAAGFTRSNAQLGVMRVISGFGGAGPLTLGGGILNDCFTAEERTQMISVYALPGQLSPALGPILGALCEQYLDWRWGFWITSIISILLQIIAFVSVRETYQPVIESRLASKHANEEHQSTLMNDMKQIAQRLRTNVFRAFKMLGTDPVVQFMSLLNGATYGIQFMLIIAMNEAWKDIYHFTDIVAAVNYLSLGVGLVVGAQILRPLNRQIYQRLKSKDAEAKGRPAFRLPMVQVGAMIVPAGLLWYGWSSNEMAFPLVPNLGVFMASIGIVMILNSTSLYIVDMYKMQSASANGAVNLLRALSGFAFPLFANKLFSGLGQGVGSTIIASAFVGLAWPIPIILWKFGSRLGHRNDT